MLGKTDAGYSITLQSTVIYFVLLFVWPDAAAADSSKVRATDGDHFWKAEINCADTRSCGTDALSTNLHTMTPIADSVDPGWVFTGIESHKVMSLECPAGRAIIIDCEGKFSAQLQTPQGSELCNFRLFEGQCNYDVQVDEISQLSDSMIVHTKFGDIRVQGTQFLVEVEPDGANIAVFGGEVRTGWVNQSSLMTGGKTRVLGANASIKEGVVSDADIRRAASLMSSADAERPPGNAPSARQAFEKVREGLEARYQKLLRRNDDNEARLELKFEAAKGTKFRHRPRYQKTPDPWCDASTRAEACYVRAKDEPDYP